MLYIRTGLMGHGKTLNTIKEIDQRARKEGRPVYFHNVTDLDASKLESDWFPFEDPHKWFDLPNDAIIVIDEAQQFFPVRDPRKDVPDYCSRFEVMRKQGHEVHLITQDPRFLDVHARRLCNKHIHYSRVFGSSNLVRYETERCFNDVEKFPSNKTADRTHIKLDRKYFGVYSSAQAAHHFKFRPSKKALFFGVASLVTLVLVVRAVLLFTGDKGTPEQIVTNQVTSAIDTASSFLAFNPDTQPVQTRVEYLSSLEPRIPNIPSSAPVYDHLTKPQSHPRLLCLSSTDPAMVERSPADSGVFNGVRARCVCYTQQATRVQTGFQFCMNASINGYFDSTIPDPIYAPQPHQPVQSPVPVPPNPLDVPSRAPGLRVTLIGDSNA